MKNQKLANRICKAKIVQVENIVRQLNQRIHTVIKYQSFHLE